MSNTMDIIIVCRDCSYQFIFPTAEQKWYEEKNFPHPLRCSKCRANKKQQKAQQKMQALTLNCVVCSDSFDFSAASQEYYKTNGWPNPVRCTDCRAKRTLSISCSMCSKDFMFSVKSQTSYTKNKWKYPVRCRVCHEDYKKMPKIDAAVDEKVDEKVMEIIE